MINNSGEYKNSFSNKRNFSLYKKKKSKMKMMP